MIDVLIPTYARTKELGEALWCVLNQTVDVRAVIVNDCPWQTLTCSHPRVFISNQTATFGTLGQKRTFALWVSDSPLILWQDDDDLCMPWHAERMINALKGTPAIAAINPSCWSLYGNEWGGGSQTIGVIARRADAIACGFPASDTGEDQEFVRRLRERGPTVGVPGEKSYVYRWANGTYHVSGAGDPMGGRGFRVDAEERKCRGKEPTGIIEIVPRLKRPYFADHPLRDQLPLVWLGDGTQQRNVSGQQ